MFIFFLFVSLIINVKGDSFMSLLFSSLPFTLWNCPTSKSTYKSSIIINVICLDARYNIMKVIRCEIKASSNAILPTTYFTNNNIKYFYQWTVLHIQVWEYVICMCDNWKCVEARLIEWLWCSVIMLIMHEQRKTIITVYKRSDWKVIFANIFLGSYIVNIAITHHWHPGWHGG